MPTAISIQGVDFAYNSKAILENVHLELQEGEFACLIGPNGGGKTTLFRLILGLVRPAAGNITVFGQQPAQGRIQIGYVPQDFAYDVRFPIRVRDVVRMGCLNIAAPSGRRTALARERVQHALETVGLADMSDRWFSRLSGGQRQRVLIARALATHPKLLLLDEPTSNVDPVGEEEILNVLGKLRGTMTVMLVTHSAGVASRYLDNIYCVNRVVHHHPPTDQLDAELMLHLVGMEFPADKHAHEGCTHA